MTLELLKKLLGSYQEFSDNLKVLLERCESVDEQLDDLGSLKTNFKIGARVQNPRSLESILFELIDAQVDSKRALKANYDILSFLDNVIVALPEQARKFSIERYVNHMKWEEMERKFFMRKSTIEYTIDQGLKEVLRNGSFL